MQLYNVFFKKCTTLIMVYRFAPNKNNQNVVEQCFSIFFLNLAATFRIWSSGRKNPYLKYVSSHFLILAIELHSVRFGSCASFPFELHCSLPSTPSLLLLFRFTFSGVPRVSRTRGRTQFWRPHPACSWLHRCEEWVDGNSGVPGVPAPGGKLSFGAPTQPVHSSIDAKNELMETVAYLGFPAPGGKLSFGAPTQPVHGSMDAKDELGTKMASKADSGPAITCI